MCGIAGLAGSLPRDAVARVREALRRLQHRGPDGVGVHASEDVVMGMRRLAIIDLKTGDQPIYNEDRSIAVVCNGELYNYVEGFRDLERRGHHLQSRSDVNLIPHYYEEEGRRAFVRLRGMFAAAVWDATRHRLTLARDRAGKKPLFYARAGGGVAFASELPALLALLDRTPAYQATAIADYLQLGIVPHPATIYQGIWTVPPACTAVFEPHASVRVEPYWSPPPPRTFRGTHAEGLAALDAALAEATRLRLRSDVPVGMFLSGGVDSGLVAAHAANAGAKDLLCFVVEVADRTLNEAPAARLTAHHLGLPIETIELHVAPRDAVERVSLLYGQPFGDSSAVPSYFVARAASRHRKVVLNGDGGDEVFAGYRRYWASRAAPWLVRGSRPFEPVVAAAGRSLARVARRRSPVGFASRILRGLASEPVARYLIWTGDQLDDIQMARCFPDYAALGSVTERLRSEGGSRPSADTLHDFQMSDFRFILADDLLPKMDIATMANSLEARSPFLDIPLVELAWTMPQHWRITARRTKAMLRDLAARRLPPEIARAPKRGFEVPVARWLRHDLQDVVADTLLAPDSRVIAMGNQKAITALVRGESEFPGNLPQVIWSLLMLELFLRAPTPLPAAK